MSGEDGSGLIPYRENLDEKLLLATKKNSRLVKRLGHGERRFRKKKGETDHPIALWFGRLVIMPHMIIAIWAIFIPFFLLVNALIGVENSYVVDSIDYTKSKNPLIITSPHGGNGHQRKFRISEKSAMGLRVGDSVTVKSLPSSRALSTVLAAYDEPVARMKFQSDRDYCWITWQEFIGSISVALFVGFILSIFVYFLWVSPMVEWFLLRVGEPALAKVTAKEPSPSESTSSGSAEMTLVFYSFKARNAERDGKIGRLQFERKLEKRKSMTLPLGTPLIVLYWPLFPSVHLVLEFSGYEPDL